MIGNFSCELAKVLLHKIFDSYVLKLHNYIGLVLTRNLLSPLHVRMYSAIFIIIILVNEIYPGAIQYMAWVLHTLLANT